MDSRVILVGSLVGFLKNRSSSVVTQSAPHLLSCPRATMRRRSSARPSSHKHQPRATDGRRR